MSEQTLLLTRPAEHVLHITLNRPKAMNALNEDLCRRLDAALAAAAEDEEVRCIILGGAGERAFTAGYDVKELASFNKEEFFVQNVLRYEWIWNLAAHPKPVIAINQGIAMGAGSIMMTAADIRIGSHDSIIRFTSTPHGAAMLTWSLPHLVGLSKAKEYLMTSRKISAEEALNHGLLNAVCDSDKLLETALTFATDICACEPSGPQNVKRLLAENIGMSQRQQMENEMRAIQAQQLDMGNRVGEWYADMVEEKKA